MGWPTGWTGFASVATAWCRWLRRMRSELSRLNCWPTDEGWHEAVARDVAGRSHHQCRGRYGVAVLTQLLVFPLFGLHTTLAENLMIGAIFTVVSIARSFALRRLFEALLDR